LLQEDAIKWTPDRLLKKEVMTTEDNSPDITEKEKLKKSRYAQVQINRYYTENIN